MESEGAQIGERRSAIRKSIICAVVPRHTTPTSCMLLRTNAGVPRFGIHAKGDLDRSRLALPVCR